MIRWLICLFKGHRFKQTMEYYGTLENGNKTYKATVGNCFRCNKKYVNPIIRIKNME